MMILYSQAEILNKQDAIKSFKTYFHKKKSIYTYKTILYKILSIENIKNYFYEKTHHN